MKRFFVSLAMTGICSLLACPIFAQSTSTDTKPTFKRLKVENRPIGSKINIQIDPVEQAAALAPPANPRPTTLIEDRIKKEEPSTANTPKTTVETSKWFWDSVSPDISAAAFDRMGTATRHMGNAPSGHYQPSLQSMQTLTQKYGKDILLATLGQEISPALVLAVIAVESSGNPDAVSTAGAQGLMQLIPDTAKRFGVTDSTDPTQNIKGGAAYLSWLLSEFGGDPLLALAGYNAGENAVRKNNGVPPFGETRAYVPKVVAAWQVARNLCTSPPVLVTEACIFQSQSIKQAKN